MSGENLRVDRYARNLCVDRCAAGRTRASISHGGKRAKIQIHYSVQRATDNITALPCCGDPQLSYLLSWCHVDLQGIAPRAMLNQHTRAWGNGERIWLQMGLHPVSLLITPPPEHVSRVSTRPAAGTSRLLLTRKTPRARCLLLTSSRNTTAHADACTHVHANAHTRTRTGGPRRIRHGTRARGHAYMG